MSNKFILKLDKNNSTNETNYLQNYKNKIIRKPIEGNNKINQIQNDNQKNPQFYSIQDLTNPFSSLLNDIK
jgi:hypothetical protein